MMKGLKSIVFVTAIVVLLLVVGCSNAASPTATPLPLPTSVPPTATQALSIATALPSPTPGPVEFVWKIIGEPEPFNSATGLALDTQGNLYVFDVGNSRVLVQLGWQVTHAVGQPWLG
jgi:NHL repeat